MNRTTERGLSLLFWIFGLLPLALLVLVIGYLLVRGGSSLSLALIFDNVPVIDALMGKRQVFDGLFPALCGTAMLVVLALALALIPWHLWRYLSL